jgi:hypothetical protein
MAYITCEADNYIYASTCNLGHMDEDRSIGCVSKI